MNSQNQKHHAARCVDALIAHQSVSLRGVRHPFWRLIQVIRARTSLLSPRLGADYATHPSDAKRIILACRRLACHRKQWYQDPEDWNPPEGSSFVQMRSLVQHLLDQYTVPDFMASVWWTDYPDVTGMELYLHLGAGYSIRRFPRLAPFEITKAMAAHFIDVPDDLRWDAAIRWSQVLALGGDARLARILVSQTLLSRQTSDERFWETVIRFLIQYQPISADETRAIVEFILEQRFYPAERIWGIGSGHHPVQPDFSLQGRTLMSLRRHMVHWRTELMEKGIMPPPNVNWLDFAWKRSDIRAFRCKQEGTTWSIEELLTPRQLQMEGKVMQHCVADYISKCIRRKTTIWSMKMQKGNRKNRQLTIEVLPQKKVIFQVSGKCNCEPSETAREILKCWADQESLTFNESI
ncbi:hypothetical protein Enr10x_42000 [Gimesia panareensis]|uniref:PcfJ-like protein n=1 Tax=Gimesia panareensis TaxID=2527978 RepID=A0A517QB50_9PLAN|nr:PcfJ domain-containing protein [Gimesia panareensis]QDT28854.1 hypothetical protein Enr10x_42000 [Gimesia panareensis]